MTDPTFTSREELEAWLSSQAEVFRGHYAKDEYPLAQETLAAMSRVRAAHKCLGGSDGR